MEQPQLTSRVVDLFLELCAIPSPPGQERAVADRVTRELDAIGLEWDEDGCGPGDRLDGRERPLPRCPANVDGGVPIFLCAHFDTVPLDGELEPVRRGRRSSATPAARSSARTTSRRSR